MRGSRASQSRVRSRCCAIVARMAGRNVSRRRKYCHFFFFFQAEDGIRDRKVLLVITDGNDNASEVTLGRVEQLAEQHEIVVYAIGLTSDARSTNRTHDELDRL